MNDANNNTAGTAGFKTTRTTQGTGADGETIERTETHTVEVKEGTFFERLGRKFENNPIKTSVATSLGVSALTAAFVNYRLTGYPIPVRLTGEEAPAFLAGLMKL